MVIHNYERIIMTVKELLEELKTFPDNSECILYIKGEQMFPLKDVYGSQNGKGIELAVLTNS